MTCGKIPLNLPLPKGEVTTEVELLKNIPLRKRGIKGD
jgi:hypothetical protein